MPKPWTTGASASLGGGDGVVTLVEGSAFCISTHSGAMDPAHPHGFFFRDTRFLSAWRIRIDGVEPEPLAATAVDPFSGAFVLRAPPAPGRADSHLVLSVRRHVGRGLREDLEVRNFGSEPESCTIEIELRGDFADVFEVKEGRVRKRGRLSREVEGTRVVLGYRRGEFRRGTHVDAVDATVVTEDRLRFDVVVPPRGEWSTTVTVTPVIDGAEVVPRYLPGHEVEPSTPISRLADWRARVPTVAADHAPLGALLARSTSDLAALRIFDPEFPDRPVIAAGAPWFMALFGRDSLLTSWMTMLVDPELALGTLETLARFQGRDVDPRTEEEPGRILHEMRFGETATLALGGGRVYYGTADATPLFVMLVAELARWGTHRDDVDRLLPAADAALEWIDRFGDRDGDGYVEYARANDTGLENQGWKDSWDAVRFADGRLATGPIAVAEVQGYVYAALLARAHLAEEAGDAARAAGLLARAEHLKRRFNEDFWIDGPGGGHLALGLDGDKRPIDGVASNQGHCLWTGIVDEERAGAVAGSLMADDMFTGWGIRTLSSSNGGFNPVSYHCGSVWPHDNAIVAAGLMRYGFVEDAHRVIAGLVDAAPWFGGLLPELFAGVARDDFGFPVPYPTSCSPQAWAAAAPLLLLRTMLRLEPDVRNARVHLAPAVPEWVGHLSVERVPLAGGHLSVEARGGEVTALEVPTGIAVATEPRPATRVGR